MEGHKQPETQGPPNETSGGSPMAMGMGMAKRMMAQMGQGGSPFEMKQMMGMCMGMCSEMLSAIQRINAMAVFATPELQNAFSGWLDQYEEKLVAALADGDKDAAALAATLGLGEDSVRYLVAHLAATGEIDLVARLRH